MPQQEATSQYRIANKIYAQMMQHFYCENGFLQEEVVGTRELEQATQRILKLDEGIQRLYEDNIEGKVSDERFAKMTAIYEQEQKILEGRVLELRDVISNAKVQRLNIDFFLTQVKKHTEVKELDAEVIRALMERIDVFKPEKVPGTRTKKQAILIH